MQYILPNLLQFMDHGVRRIGRVENLEIVTGPLTGLGGWCPSLRAWREAFQPHMDKEAGVPASRRCHSVTTRPGGGAAGPDIEWGDVLSRGISII